MTGSTTTQEESNVGSYLNGRRTPAPPYVGSGIGYGGKSRAAGRAPISGRRGHAAGGNRARRAARSRRPSRGSSDAELGNRIRRREIASAQDRAARIARRSQYFRR